MAGKDTKDQARAAAEKRREQAEAGGESALGEERNKPHQTVHEEGEQVHATHDENIDVELADLYEDTSSENEILEWRRHSDLDAPPAREGFVNRFIRIRLGTVRDTARLRNAMREGWRPVKRENVSDRSLPSIHLEQFGDVIGVEDLILCEMPQHRHAERMEFYRKKRARQDEAIQRQLAAQSQAGATGFGSIQQQRSSSVSVPQRNVEVAADEI